MHVLLERVPVLRGLRRPAEGAPYSYKRVNLTTNDDRKRSMLLCEPII